MPQVDLLPPLGGLSDALSFDAQPRGTSTLLVNTSSLDPVTGRVRFGPRAGCEQYNTNSLGPGNRKVQALVQSISDNRRTVFTAETTAAPADLSEGDVVTPSADNTADGVPDGFGNLFVIDGKAALVKYNSKLHEVWRFSLPVKDDGQVCRAIALDPFGNVYVGVSEGGAQSAAHLWAFSPDDDLGLKLRWTRSNGAFVERLRWQDGYLYAIENDTDTNRAYYVLWSGADTATPVLAQRKDVTAPVGDFVVNSAGAVITTHPPSASRRLDPRYPDYSYFLDEQRWQPHLHLTDWKRRIWCEIDVSDLKNQPGYANVKDGDPVTIIRDKWGSGRKLIADPGMSTAGTPKVFIAPTYVEKGPGGRPALRFSGNRCRMISEMNPNAEEAMADLQRTLVPGYKNGGYVLMIVCKPTASSSTERIFSQTNTAAPGVREIYANTPGTGDIHSDQSKFGGTGNAPSGADGKFDNKTGMAIITTVSGNGHFIGSSGFDSVWRVNGWPLAEFIANNFYTAGASTTIVGCKNDETQGFTGDITRILVLRDYTPSDQTVPAPRTLITFPDYPGSAYDPFSDTEIEQLEGWAAWGGGTSHMLDDGASGGWALEGASSAYKHAFSSDINFPYTAQQGPPNPDGKGFENQKDIDLFSPYPLSAKWSSQRGNLQWTKVGSGHGYGIAIDSDDYIFTVGPIDSTLSGGTLNKWRDRGDSVTLEWALGELNGAFASVDYSYQHARLATDKFKNVYVPFHWAGSANNASLVIYDTNGFSVLRYKVAGTLFGYSVAVDPSIPDYGAQPITLPEFVYLTTRNTGIAANPTVHKIRLVARAVTSGSARDTAIVGVCDGYPKRFSAGSGTPTLISSVPAGLRLDPDGLVCGIWAYGEIFFLDGTNYISYSPVTDVLTKWECTSAGAIQPNARWMTLWNGRCWLIRCPGDPHNWHASAQGDFRNWDTGPVVVKATQAVSGNDAEMGMLPDIPNTLIPWTRESMIVGCDHTMQLVYGDPMAGGSITEIAKQTGASFGPSWCMDDQGAVYFFGQPSGVYRVTKSKGIEPISGNIERRLMDTDFSLYYMQLGWNPELDELHVMEMPYGQGGVPRRRWRWQRAMGAWHQDTHFTPSIQPTTFCTFDADSPTDRAFLFGCEDGRARNWARNAKDDDGYPIDYQAVLGPYGIDGRECRIGQPTIVLASDQGGCSMEFFASEVADVMGEGVHRQELVAGRNQTLMRWIRGSRAWIKLSSCAAGNRSSFESGTMNVVDVGRVRVRS